MDRIIFRGAQVLLDGRLTETDVRIAQGRIDAVGRGLDGGDVVRVEGYLLPGLIDEHIHGIAGHDTMDGAQAVLGMARQLVRHGVTSFLPTTMNAGIEPTRAALAGVAAAMRENADGAGIPGAHMEGPFLCEKYKGAQDARANLAPSVENFEKLTGEDAGIVRLITLAPELPGAEEFIRWAAGKGIVCSAGHTDASYEQMEQAAQWGVTQVTHLFNGMNPLHHRNPGVPGAALTLPGLSCQVISDGIHLHPAAVRLALRAGHALLITDSLQAADMPDGVYELGGQKVTVKAGVARIAAGNLAGSTLTLERAVANAMRFAELPLGQVAPMASARVEDSLHLSDRGRIRAGLRADLCLLDGALEAKMTVVGGKILFERS